MKRRTARFVYAATMASVMLGTMLGAQPTVAHAQETCVTDFGTKVPVVFVHGLGANRGTWGNDDTPDSMIRSLKELDSIWRFSFDYRDVNDQWVTNPDIGPKLAETIDCLAQASRKNGGLGKVIVVAHSMGGLAARYAASQTVDDRKVADELLGVIPIASPHLGSPYGTIGDWGLTGICRLRPAIFWDDDCMQSAAIRGLAQNSTQLQELPPFPENVPVKAIAGDVTERNVLLFALVKRDTNSDLVVPVESALDEYTEEFAGDGKKTFECEGIVVVGNVSTAPCAHGALLKNPDVQKEVKESIEQFIGSAEQVGDDSSLLPPHHTGELVGKLTIPYLDSWGSAMSEEGAFKNIVDNTNCNLSNADCPHIGVFNLEHEENRAQFGDDPLKAATVTGCYAESGGAYGSLELKATLSVDGEEVEYYEQVVCPPGITPQITNYVWYAKDHGVLIWATDTQAGKIAIDDLRAAIAAITWL